MSEAATLFDTAIPVWDILLRLLAACVAGFVLGLERELFDRSAGLRTHMLVALAAALFTVVTLELALASNGLGEAARADPLRIIEAVTAGVAFLGAGAIIQSRGNVRGLTTAAGMWLAGAVGVACGAGLYVVTAIATVLGVAVIVLVRAFEAGIMGTKPSARSGRNEDE